MGKKKAARLAEKLAAQQLVMTWHEVTDATGRVRMEAAWTTAAALVAAKTSAA